MNERKLIDFNINEHVYVRLTEAGREELRRQHREVAAGLPSPLPGDGVPEETDGWSRWQFWVLMFTFGPRIRHGGPPLFELTIRLETDER